MTKAKKNQKPDNLYTCGLALLASGLFLYAVVKITGFPINKLLLPCILHEVTGLYCPGCGGTRAFMHLLHGDIGQSLHYHPLVLYGSVLYGWYMVSNTIQILTKSRIRCGMQYRSVYVWIGIAILVLNCIWKNAVYLSGGLVF